MDMRQSVKMFWNVPELVERIFLLLDPSSALHLAQAEVIDKQIFKKSFSSKVWMSLIKQSSYGEEQRYAGQLCSAFISLVSSCT